jgi:carbonic anhydrase
MPSILEARAAGATGIDDFVRTHIQRTVEGLLGRSVLLAGEVAAGRCAVVGLSYRLADGTVGVVASRGPLPSEVGR